MLKSNSTQQETIAEQYQNLPIILEIQHNRKIYRFVHTDIHINDWEEFKKEALKNNYFIKGEQSAMQIAL